MLLLEHDVIFDIVKNFRQRLVEDSVQTKNIFVSPYPEIFFFVVLFLDVEKI